MGLYGEGICPFHLRIKPGQPKSRNTLHKRVKQLAGHDIDQAFAVASEWPPLSETKEELKQYYRFWRNFVKAKAGQLTEMQIQIKEMEKLHAAVLKQFPGMQLEPIAHLTLEQDCLSAKYLYEAHLRELTEKFINAVNNFDAATIHEIADAVQFLKTYKPTGDALRAKLMVLKRYDVKLSITAIAMMVEWDKAYPDRGTSDLAKLCRELCVPYYLTHGKGAKRSRGKQRENKRSKSR